MIEDKHINRVSPNIITFYVRTDQFDGDGWAPQVKKVNGCFLEITAMDPLTEEVLYLPFRRHFTPEELVESIQPNRTTIIDIELVRLPSPDVFKAVKF